MVIIFGVIVFFIGLVILSFGARTHTTIEYAILYLTSIITMCTIYISNSLKRTALDSKNPNAENAPEIMSWSDFLKKIKRK